MQLTKVKELIIHHNRMFSLLIFYLAFLLRTLTDHRTTWEGRGPSLFLNSSTCSQTLKTFIYSFAFEVSISYF